MNKKTGLQAIMVFVIFIISLLFYLKYFTENLEDAKENPIIEKIKLNSSLNYLKGLTNEGDPLAHIPPLNAKINLSYEKFGHNITCYAIYNAWKFARDYDKDGVDNIKEATARGNPSWLTLNMAYYKKITDEMTFKIAIQNITDLHYKTFGSGLSAGGRNYVIAIQTEF